MGPDVHTWSPCRSVAIFELVQAKLQMMVRNQSSAFSATFRYDFVTTLSIKKVLQLSFDPPFDLCSDPNSGVDPLNKRQLDIQVS